MLLHITFDPTGHFKSQNVPEERLAPACGYLLGWACNYATLVVQAASLKEAMDAQYGFGLHEMTGGKITEGGIYKYPEDPDMYPLVKVQTGEEYMYIYQHAIIAFNDGFVTRMD